MNQQTNNLIDQLSGSPQVAYRSVNAMWMAQLGAAIFAVIVISIVALLSPWYQFREGYTEIVALNPILVFKQFLPLVIAIGAFSIIQLGRYPESSLKKRMSQVVGVVMLFALGVVAYAFAITPVDKWLVSMNLSGIQPCLIVISLGSIAASVLWISTLRRDAVTKPKSVGFWIGVNAGAVTAVIYALVCTDDSPLFFVPWYTMAIVLSGVIGMLIASKILKW